MDIYDHVQQDLFTSSDSNKNEDNQQNASAETRPNVDLNTELQETFRAFSTSPWGSRLGGLWDNVRKQGESYYEGARQEYAAASEEAVKGFSDLKDTLVGRTRGLSLSTAFNAGSAERGTTEGSLTPTEARADETAKTEQQKAGTDNTQSSSGESFLSRFKAEASRRLKEIEKAEEAADEAILRFGMNITQKLREAVTIVPPEEESGSKVLFESKDAEGKRVIHATRFEAQLHVIHTTLDSFLKDPVSDEWPAFSKSFNVGEKTAAIAADLEKYHELRAAMEKLVPEKVQYADFWSRYYFLRLVIETEEQKRKELLKGASVEEDEEVGWDDDSDDDTDSPSTPEVSDKAEIPKTATKPSTDANLLKPNEPRRSNDQVSQPDSESSYDLVSGASSRTPASPKEKAKDDDSDDDWE
ncbi:BSD-domain-containing protein [Aspergillus pseudodeflectus]|uniref:BSD-domain-containing protein n=1 Tax=Aspergillus pseudodeflectus TaxID=176178 RepID=A0ABR4LAX8_9EURO